ncbi:hypothetical protein B0H10DRAFT_2221506 [Mycena sp. CBHHK59/15]|nr:hypothetical protein B0H10DRAFT_2221506 [Mycena sp. CBHHK59/15]
MSPRQCLSSFPPTFPRYASCPKPPSSSSSPPTSSLLVTQQASFVADVPESLLAAVPASSLSRPLFAGSPQAVLPVSIASIPRFNRALVFLMLLSPPPRCPPSAYNRLPDPQGSIHILHTLHRWPLDFPFASQVFPKNKDLWPRRRSLQLEMPSTVCKFLQLPRRADSR